MKKWKAILSILAGLAAGTGLLIGSYKPFGGKTRKEDWAEYERRADNFKEGKFTQLSEVPLMTGEKSAYDRSRLKPEQPLPVHMLEEIPQADADQLKWTWLGHSSSLLQLGGKNILIDPVFSDYASPVQFVGPKRFTPPPIDMENLPEIDVIVLSHDHYDHLDYNSIRKLDAKTKAFVVPLGVEKHLLRWGVSEEKIHTVAWWEEVEIDDGALKITSTPGQHFTGRLPWRSGSTLWCGYAFQTAEKTVFFTGDTGYGAFFEDIHERIGDVDLLLLECGQYDQSWGRVHMFPEQGAQVIETMQAKWTIPIHWGTFCICKHPWDDSITQISAYANKQGYNLATPQMGEIVDYDNIGDCITHW